ncbi:MAG TPA: HEAT repeat domain-containing protein [Thermoanaerobaculia bacterium]|nr:HEAT repeat domain-containing protein [Thermoanaerobaculia bacterium]
MKPWLILAGFSLLATGLPIRASEYVTMEEIRQYISLAIKKLASPEPRERLTATTTIQAWHKYATPAVPALTRALNDKDVTVRTEAAHALELIGAQAFSAVPALARSLDDPTPEVKAAAAFALGAIGTKDSSLLPRLLKAARDPADLVSLAGLFAAVRLFPKAVGPPINRQAVAEHAVPLLITALNEETAYDSVRLARAIGIVDPSTGYSAVDRLIQLANSEDVPVVSNAAHALEALGPTLTPYLPSLQRNVRVGTDAEKKVAIRRLGWLRTATPTGLTAIEQALRSKSPEIQRDAAEALGRIGAPAKSKISSLVALFSSPDESLRSAAAKAVLRISPAALEKNLPILAHSDPKLAQKMRDLLALSQL